ncbi:MAG: S26 family signal peptidase [Candidatus Limnocylindrus sp.]
MTTARRIWRAVVAENSMAPALLEGDLLLVLPAGPAGLPWLRSAPREGSIVIVEREGRLDVKRVAARTIGVAGASDSLWLLGDNAAVSNDSRQTGPVPLSALRGIVVFRTGPAGRRGRVR